MLKIISNTPLYVWPLLALLIWGGWKARKTYVVSWKNLCVMPAIMFIWSLYSIATRYDTSCLCYWAISLAMGIWFGSLTARTLNLRFDKVKKSMEVSGNWSSLILMLAIFSLRYFLGATYGMHPELAGNSALLFVENIATAVSGMFLGRILVFWQKYRTSSHTDLEKA